MARRSRYSRATTETSSISAPARSMVAGTQESSGVAVVGCTTSASELSPTRASYTDGVPTLWSTPRAVLVLPCGSRSMTSVRSPYSARATPRLTEEVVLPTPPFWLAMVMTRMRPGVGNGSWSAACRTWVARSASLAICLSNSTAEVDCSAVRLLRSRWPGSVISGPSCRSVSRGTDAGSRTGFHVERASPGPSRHHHHGSGSLPQPRSDSPCVDLAHPGRLQLGHQRRQLLQRAGPDEGDQLGARAQQPAAPRQEPGQGRHGPCR